LDVDAEPRIRRTLTDESPRANHPFFWSGYLLVDPGNAAAKPDAKPDGPKKPAAQ